MTRPARILHALCRVASGGVEQRLPLLLDHLPPGEFVHEVVCQDSSGELATALRARGCAIHEIGRAPSLVSPGWYRKGIRHARRFRPDIIHGGVIEGNALASVIGLALPSAKVIAEETSHPLTRKRHTEAFLRLLFRRSDAVIGVSPAVCDYLRARLKITPAKLVLVDNGVPDAPEVGADERSRLRAEFGLGEEALVIGTVGRVQDDDKRMSDLIRALPRIVAAVPEARLLIIGDGADRPMLETLAADLGVAPFVHFAGYRGNPRPYYAIMDLFALVSATEAFGLVLVEAMLAGVPVIGTAVGGIPHVLDHGRAGRLVERFAPDQIATVAISLLNDPAERRRLGGAGRTHARTHFSASRYAADIARLYRRLLGRDGQ